MKRYHNNGELSSLGNYQDGQLQGDYFGYHTAAR